MRKTAPGLDVTRVVDAALAIADADGLDQLSMRRLSTELGVTPMAIYHHVAGKEALLDLVADESLRALPEVNTSAPCAAELERTFTELHHLFLAHPALAEAIAQRPLEGPRATRVGEAVLELLARAGVSDADAVSALLALTQYTLGASLYRLSRRRSEDPGGRRERFEHLRPEDAPRAHAIRRSLASASDDAIQFGDGLRRLIASYVA